jgi:cell division septum initiation protein DivIVA|tara:strand:+ start:1617 stop:1823 length:207 start_codon:yes stop_codon:yes gene_type:complete
MSKKQKEKTVILVDDVEHIYEDMTDEQKTLINHVNDLDRKISTSQFNLDQLMFGKSAFVNALSNSLQT